MWQDFDYELGEKKHLSDFVCDEHKVSKRVEGKSKGAPGFNVLVRLMTRNLLRTAPLHPAVRSSLAQGLYIQVLALATIRLS